MASKYREVSMKACRSLVIPYHYSGRMPSNVQLCYGDVVTPPLSVVACCIFSIATGRWEVHNLWELTRLVRLPEYDKPLTRMIGNAIGHIRKHKLANLVLSFADIEEDHHGGIYQAASWIYSGTTKKRLDGFNIDGVFVPARTCNQRHGTSSVSDLKKSMPNSQVTPHFDLGKHLYWKPINKAGMKKAVEMGLKSLAYPKPMLARGKTRNTIRSSNQDHKGKVVLPCGGSQNSIEEGQPTKMLIGRGVVPIKKPQK